MKYYIIKKGDTIDSILNKFGITYQNFISLNDGDFKDLIKVGNKIIVENNNYSRTYKDDINRIYQNKNIEKDEEIKYICPHCKNIILIPKQQL